MKTIIKSLSLFLCSMLLVMSIGIRADAADTVASGSCGENATWTLSSDGLLTVTGTGAMNDIGMDDPRPWNPYLFDIKKVAINEGITTVGTQCFHFCKQLESVQLPESLELINGFAFSYCESLKTIRIPEKVKEIGEYAFSSSGLTSIELKDGLKKIGDDCFSGTNLTEIYLPDSVTEAGNSALAGCENLKKVHLSKNMFQLSVELFSGCKSLENLEIPSGIVRIASDYMSEYYNGFNTSEPNAASGPMGVFCKCENLKTVTIPKSLVYVGHYAFGDCTALQTVYYESSAEDWNKIEIGDDNDPLINARKVYQGGGSSTPATGVKLNLSAANVEVGNTSKLTATVSPAAADQKVTWKSGNEKVATVDSNGNVKGIKTGKATITATTANGKTAKCEVTVIFTDVPATGIYYSAPVYWAVEKGITNGYTDDDGLARTFKPQNNCTREAVVTFLWRLAGKPEPKSMTSKFRDVKDKSKYYYKAVLWAAEKGIAGGYSDGTFRPSDTCLREHVVTFLWRYAGKPEVSMANSFTDVKTSDYYYKAVLWAAKNNITKGYADDHYKTFRPKLDCLREHVVTFLYRHAK